MVLIFENIMMSKRSSWKMRERKNLLWYEDRDKWRCTIALCHKTQQQQQEEDQQQAVAPQPLEHQLDFGREWSSEGVWDLIWGYASGDCGTMVEATSLALKRYKPHHYDNDDNNEEELDGQENEQKQEDEEKNVCV